MDIKTIERVKKEAERFVDAANKWILKAESEGAQHRNGIIYGPSKEGAACKRASMDLTRALADLRR